MTTRILRISGERFELPPYVQRRDRYWIVKVPGQPTRNFPDAGSPRAAYVAAVAWRNLRAIDWPPPSLQSKERSDKLRTTGRAGVMITPKYRNGRMRGYLVVAMAGPLRVTRFVAAGGDLRPALAWANAERDALELAYAQGYS